MQLLHACNYYMHQLGHNLIFVTSKTFLPEQREARELTSKLASGKMAKPRLADAFLLW